MIWPCHKTEYIIKHDNGNDVRFRIGNKDKLVAQTGDPTNFREGFIQFRGKEKTVNKWGWATLIAIKIWGSHLISHTYKIQC